MQNSHDIIIVGGGMVGLALACMLAQKTSLSIAILEVQSQQHVWSADNYHHRVSAIALSSQRIFQSLNVWNNIRDKRVSPFTKIQVWDAEGQGEIEFDSKEIAEPLLGYIIENHLIQSVLEDKIKQYPHVEMISPVKLTQVIENENGIELVTDTGEKFKTKLVIAADGANSWLRTQVGIHVERHDYHQEAIVATVQTALAHHRVARQVFLNTGPLAFLPLAAEKLSSIVWSVPVKEAQRLMALEDKNFSTALTQAFEYRLGDIVKIEKRYAFSLYKQHAHHYIKPHVALVGDAAHTLHPLAGQGVNIGLLDAASLAEVVMDAIAHRRDFSSHVNLRRYERWRKADNYNLLTGVDLLKQLFASEHQAIQLIRSCGTNLTNRMHWIKNYFMRHAVGDRNGLPIIAR
jgi:2-octaprenylphenol hydroxylase